GPGAFDDLVKFRFPLVTSDKDALERELRSWKWGDLTELDPAITPEKFPNSPLPRDLLTKQPVTLAASGDHEGALRFGKQKLGLVSDWKVIAPFSQDGAAPGGMVFPPEYEVDFAKQYPARQNTALWQAPTDHAPVILESTGWVRLEFPYMDETATYA